MGTANLGGVVDLGSSPYHAALVVAYLCSIRTLA